MADNGIQADDDIQQLQSILIENNPNYKSQDIPIQNPSDASSQNLSKYDSNDKFFSAKIKIQSSKREAKR